MWTAILSINRKLESVSNALEFTETLQLIAYLCQQWSQAITETAWMKSSVLIYNKNLKHK